jgi:hypothetical protein
MQASTPPGRGPGAALRYSLVRVPSLPGRRRLSLEDLARASGAHPELITKLVTLGVIEAEGDRGAPGGLWFSSAQVADMARIQRLRAGFALNYAALGLVTDLLDRIAALETALRGARRGGR